ncbi:SGNH/GDSL hydrolase family protein [Nonomuraea sp. NPDC050404]|uniref:SGNH/GDSL hydrolase family protein n=1 Tax=Nonomuraea sp. NPDC050404 TaxID=3155783 RepID=UPI0033D0D339
MQIETGLRGRYSRVRDRRSPYVRNGRPAALAAVVLAVAGVLAGCGSADGSSVGTSSSNSASQQATGKKVLWLGDSIAGVQAPALGAALEASGVEFRNSASDGGGTVVEGDKMTAPLAKSAWKDLRENIASFRPDVIAYQITTYDWGTVRQQRDSYDKLAKTARKADAELVIVSAPPYRLDEFYKKHEGAIRSAPKAAGQVADGSGGAVHFLDSAALWGADSAAAEAQRSSDGIHSCQQGSAAFAKWFTEQLGKRYDFTPAAPEQWARGSWVSDPRFAKLGCG